VADLIDGRRLVYIGGASRKFWEWRLWDETAAPGSIMARVYHLQFRWGRLGTAGQTLDEYFADRSYAEWKARAKEKEKRAKGYVEDREAKRIGRAVLGLDKPRRTTVAVPVVAVTAARRIKLR
jgi:predicted DNA-binding WGR domain protein